MILAAVVDDGMGMLFNGRRQSRDKVLQQRILQLAEGKTLRMNEYSRKLFGEDCGDVRICADDNFLETAEENDLCFDETEPPASAEARIKKLVLFRWNRSYPADLHFDIDLGSGHWRMASSEDFAGSSHERITMEVYVRD